MAQRRRRDKAIKAKQCQACAENRGKMSWGDSLKTPLFGHTPDTAKPRPRQVIEPSPPACPRSGLGAVTCHGVADKKCVGRQPVKTTGEARRPLSRRSRGGRAGELGPQPGTDGRATGPARSTAQAVAAQRAASRPPQSNMKMALGFGGERSESPAPRAGGHPQPPARTNPTGTRSRTTPEHSRPDQREGGGTDPRRGVIHPRGGDARPKRNPRSDRNRKDGEPEANRPRRRARLRGNEAGRAVAPGKGGGCGRQPTIRKGRGRQPPPQTTAATGRAGTTRQGEASGRGAGDAPQDPAQQSDGDRPRRAPKASGRRRGAQDGGGAGE